MVVAKCDEAFHFRAQPVQGADHPQGVPRDRVRRGALRFRPHRAPHRRSTRSMGERMAVLAGGRQGGRDLLRGASNDSRGFTVVPLPAAHRPHPSDSRAPDERSGIPWSGIASTARATSSRRASCPNAAPNPGRQCLHAERLDDPAPADSHEDMQLRGSAARTTWPTLLRLAPRPSAGSSFDSGLGETAAPAILARP